MTNYQRNKKMAMVRRQLALAVYELREVAADYQRIYSATNRGSMQTKDRNAVVSLYCADELADYAAKIEALNHQLQDLNTPYERKKREAA